MSTKPPLFSAAGFLLVMLSLSVGWGIRGNYGHEYGAMIPGALAGMAAALMSGREDWRERLPYFGFFGALGWAFGGSISYLLAPTYTESGHLPTQLYGFAATFFEAFLWAGLGGAATAYAAAEDRENLTALFRPLLWVFAFWTVQYALEDTPWHWRAWLFPAAGADATWFRQRDPLYWLDSEWVEAAYALAALCLFDLWDRRFGKWPRLVILGAVGAGIGWGVQQGLAAMGWLGPLVAAVAHPQGDLGLLNPATGEPRFKPEELVLNWPGLFVVLARHLGWMFGGVAGVALYFYRYGAWRSGSALLIRMAVWSLLVFLAGPVLLSNVPLFQAHGGFRLTPPRGDSWANILGCLIGLLLYFRKTGRKPVVFAAVLAGLFGGLALTTAQLVKVLCYSPGNPRLTQDPVVVEAWAHWRGANWHSLALEQFAGLLFGLAIVVPLGLLATRLPVHRDCKPVRPWTKVFAVVFLLNILTYLNGVKNVSSWTAARKVVVQGLEGTFQPVAEVMRAPFFEGVQLPAWSWFTLMWLAFTGVTLLVLVRHRRQPVSLVPSTALGRGQLLYLLVLWLMVLLNFTKAVVSFSEARIATEGLIMFNALACTGLLLCGATRSLDIPVAASTDFDGLTRKAAGLTALLLVVTTLLYTGVIRGLYGDQPTGWGGLRLRFGPEADWRVRPVLKSTEHR